MKEKEFINVEKLEDGVTVITTNKNIDSIIPQLFGLENTINKQSTKWIDLGLPSGTLWASDNEEDYYTYDEAVKQFGDNLPTKEQLEELKTECQWIWDNKKKRYIVIGPNENCIILPAAGCRDDDNGAHNVGSKGYYWSSTLYNSRGSGYLHFKSDDVYTSNFIYQYGFSVRLVKNK